MMKIFSLLKRKAGLSHEEFLRYWDERHGPLAASTLPQIRRLVHYHPLRLGEGAEPQFDGIAEAWVDDLPSFQALVEWYLGEKGKAVREDDENFVDGSASVTLLVEEKVIK